MIYELRLYCVTHGRMEDVQSRFVDHLPVLFARHGVRCVGAWIALAGPDAPRFVYLMQYDDYAQRESVWASFYGDPDWARVRAETNAGHEMIERYTLLFLKPHPSWRADTTPAAQAPCALYEMSFQQVAPGQTAAVSEFLADTYLPLIKQLGARTQGVFDQVSGSGLPQLVLFHAWPDADSWHRSRSALQHMPELRDAFKAQRLKLGSPLFGRSETNLLEPLPGMSIAPGLGEPHVLLRTYP